MDYRLKRQKDFNEVFQKGKRVYSKSFTLLYIPKHDLKIGISVSKKHGNAVERNHIKRLIRAVYIPLIKRLKSYHIVFLPKVGEKFTFNDFLRDFTFLAKKEKLVDEESIVDPS